MKRDNLIDQYPAGYNKKHIDIALNITCGNPLPKMVCDITKIILINGSTANTVIKNETMKNPNKNLNSLSINIVFK